jgi:hypothetical protein
MTAGTRNRMQYVTADEPDTDYRPQSKRVVALLNARARRQKEEAKRVEAAVAKLDNERPSLIELDHAKPGPERQRAYDRHYKVVTGSRPRRGDVQVIFDEDDVDFHESMAREDLARAHAVAHAVALFANAPVDPTGNNFKVEDGA